VRFSARAIIDHPAGQPAAVGLLLASPRADLRARIAELDRNGVTPPSGTFSGWREVSSEQPININVLLETPVVNTMDLIIVSRATGESVDFSWLKVRDFRMVKQEGGDDEGVPAPVHAPASAPVAA
jgi:hypothetical protein